MVHGKVAHLEQGASRAHSPSRPGSAAAGRVSDVVTSVPRKTSRTAGLASTSAGLPSPTNEPAGQADQPLHRGRQRAHDVLDPDHRDPLGADRADDPDQLRDLRIGEAARHLVEQQQPGAGRQRAGQLKPLALQQAEPLRREVGLGGQPGPLQHGRRRRVARPAPQPGALLDGDEHVLEDGHLPERPRHLEGPADPQPAPGGRAQPGDRRAVEPDRTRRTAPDPRR